MRSDFDAGEWLAVSTDLCPGASFCSGGISAAPDIERRRLQGASPLFGGAIGAGMGAHFPGALRIELEVARRGLRSGEPGDLPPCLPFDAPACGIDPGEWPDALDQYGAARAVSGLVNVAWESPPALDGLRFYAGAGLGVARVRFRSQQFVPIEIVDAILLATYENEDRRNFSFAWQAMGGVSLDIAPNWSVFAEGRYFSARRREAPFSWAPDHDRRASLRGVSALGGLRYSFR